jgi:hypothetical protein
VAVLDWPDVGEALQALWRRASEVRGERSSSA